MLITQHKITFMHCVLAGLLIVPGMSGAEENSWSLDIALTPWYASWEQSSTAAERFGADAIVVNYKIDNALAYDLKLAAGFENISFSLQSIQQQQQWQQHEDEVAYTVLGFSVADIVGDMHLDYRHTRGEFSGYIDGAANGGATGTGSFRTDLTIQDLSLLIFKGVGVGVRQVDYELPQDLYLINTASPNNVLVSGFQDIRYKGTFLQIVAMSPDHYSRTPAADVGTSYVVRYGVGKLDAGGQFLSDTEALLINNSLLAAGEHIMSEGDSRFVEADVGMYMRFNLAGNALKAGAGYRLTQWTAEFNSGSAYQLVTDFETEFSGPYLSVTGEFR